MTGSANDAVLGKHLEEASTKTKTYVLQELLELSQAVAAEIGDINSVEYIVGTQTAATGAWTGVTKDSALYAGKVIIYKLPYAGSGNATLNLTLADGKKTGAKNIYRYGSTRLTTQYAANYYIPLIFNGTYWFAFADYDTNYYDRARISNAVTVASGAIQAVSFVASSDGIHYKQLSAGSSFDINFPVLYNSAAVADGATMSTSLYFALGSVNLQTLLADTARTFDVNKTLYLKGTLNDNIFTVHSDILTTTQPTSADGFTYLRVGRTYSAYQAYIFLFANNYFAFLDGAFKEFSPFALKALYDSTGQTISSTYLKNISANNGILTLTKGDDSLSTLTAYSLPTASTAQKGGVKIGNGLSMTGDTLNVTLSSGNSASLDTVPANKNGSLWYQIQSGSPVLKFFYGGHSYSLNPIIDTVSPNLTVSPSTATISSGSAVATVSYSGTGTVTVSSTSQFVTPSYNPSTKTVSVPYSSTEAAANGITHVTVSLSASTGYTAATALFTVTQQQTNLGDFSVALSDDTEASNLTPATLSGSNRYSVNVPFSIFDADSVCIQIIDNSGEDIDTDCFSIHDRDGNVIDQFSYEPSEFKVLEFNPRAFDFDVIPPITVSVDNSANGGSSATIILYFEE